MRDTVDIIRLIKKFEDTGVFIRFLDDGINTGVWAYSV